MRQLAQQHRFDPQDVARIVIEVSDKVLSHHAERAPRDVGTAQYSVPFSVALALFRDPADPQAFLDGPSQDPKILELCKKIELRPYGKTIATGNNATCRLEITLADGRTLISSKTDFDEDDVSESPEKRVERKFLNLTNTLPAGRSAELLARLNAIERQNVAELFSF
jgi:2-methylcitrate dehydratase PrpD